MARRGARRARQRGNMVAAVSAIGMAGTLAISAVMNSAVVLEDRAIEANLAETRAYWGAMGQFNYALSRAAYDNACPLLLLLCTGTDVSKATGMQMYLNELGSSYTALTYPENSGAYVINVTAAAAVDETPGKHASSGFLKMTSTVGATSGAPGALENAVRLPRYEIRFCMGLSNGSQSCGNIASGHSAYTSYYRVRRLTRMAQ